MLKKMFYCLLLFILPLSFKTLEYDTLEELTPYNLVFLKGKGDYKIFKYIPTLDEEENGSITNIYAQGVSSMPFYLAIYDDISEIKFEEDGFVNYISKFSLKTNSIEIKELECNKEYYFVVYIMDHDIIFLQFSILPGKVDKIDISSLSKSLILFQRTEKEEVLYYSSNESKNISISIFDAGKIKIIEKNDKEEENILIDMDVAFFTNLFEFENNKKYFIYYSSEIEIEGDRSLLILQEFNEFEKHDFNNGPIAFSGSNAEYNYEIDISKYNVGEYIIFLYFGSDDALHIKYRYNNSLSDNLIELKKYEGPNYIPLKITEKASSIILNLRLSNNMDKLLAIDLFRYSYEEIQSEGKRNIKGPKLFYINSYLFNNLNAIGIQSNYSYYLKQLEIGEDSLTSSYEKVSIITQDYAGLGTQAVSKQKNIKDIYIFLNSDNYYSFEIKKFNYPIYYLSSSSEPKIYAQLCNKNNTKNDIYFYSSDNFFTPIFGNLNITYSKDLTTLDDLKFDKSIEDNFKFRSPTYLKISCDNPAMFTNIRYTPYNHFTDTYNLKSGEKIYLSQFELNKYKYAFDKTLAKQEIKFKVNVFGLKKDQSIKLLLNETEYNLNSTKSLEIYYKFLEDSEDHQINFIFTDNSIKNNILIEIIVSSLSNDLEAYTPIEFTNNMEPIKIQGDKSAIIKIPKDFNEELLNYMIVFPKTWTCEVEISYDNIEYIVPRKMVSSSYKNYYELVSLFKSNPYSFLPDDEENSDKFFYILIYNAEFSDLNLSFKKPKIISDIVFNKLNALPELKDAKNNYYQINIPKGDYNSLIFQIISVYNTINTVQISISHNNIEQPYIFENCYYYSLPINLLNPIINIYNTEHNNYINIVPSKEFKLKEDKIYTLNATINQVNNTNKLNIRMNSLSHYYSPLIYKYYLIINTEGNEILDLASIISGHSGLDASKNQTIIAIEEDSNNIKEIFEKEIEIHTKMNNDKNIMIIVPAIKENNLTDFDSREQCQFEFEFINYPENNENQGNNLVLICCFCGVIFLLLLFIIIIFCWKRKKKTQNQSIEQKVLNQELTKLEDI